MLDYNHRSGIAERINAAVDTALEAERASTPPRDYLGASRLGQSCERALQFEFAWSRQMGFAQVAPVKGVEGFTRTSPVTGPTYVDATVAGKRLRRGARLWTVATSTFKAETYRFLRQDRPTREEQAAGALCPPGAIHLPDWADGEWLKQLTAEQLVTVKGKRGFTRLEWQKLRERNEALDTRVYARAAAWIAGADRWPEARWADLEAQLGVTKSDGPEAGAATAPSVLTRPIPRRRTVRSSYMR